MSVREYKGTGHLSVKSVGIQRYRALPISPRKKARGPYIGRCRVICNQKGNARKVNRALVGNG